MTPLAIATDAHSFAQAPLPMCGPLRTGSVRQLGEGKHQQFLRSLYATRLAGAAYTGEFKPGSILKAWSSFAWDSNRGDVILWGGGHANYGGNAVYRWRDATQIRGTRLAA
jgi:hypothetical protein